MGCGVADQRSGRASWPTWFVREAISEFELIPSEVIVFVVIFDHADATRRAYPSQATIAAESNLSRSTVQKALRHLVELGLLISVRGSTGRGRAAEYEIPKRKPRRLAPRFVPNPIVRATFDEEDGGWHAAPLPPRQAAPRGYAS
jgi:DNA-binding transcriptional MocR family regulator